MGQSKLNDYQLVINGHSHFIIRYEAEAFFEFEKNEDQEESWLVWFIKLFFG